MKYSKSFKKLLAFAACLALACGLVIGCSGQSSSSSSSQSQSQEKTLADSTLNIYCGAGMTDPFTEIANAFSEETGCTMNVTYANAAQIQTQINTTKEGDFFIAGAADELKPVEEYVASSVDLVNHIPVLVVPSNNPAHVTNLKDLVNCTKVLVGDPESTPIGKIAKNVLTKQEIWDTLMNNDIITTTTTAPQIATALANGEGQAGIVWKENVTSDNVTIIECEPMKNAIKTIPCAELTFASDEAAVKAFNEFMQSQTAWDIWAQYGYERVAA